MFNSYRSIFTVHRSIIPLLLLSVLTLSAQTQYGVVKTKGRMVDGHLVPGKGLSGAIVKVKGRTAILVNQDNGSFSFPVTSQTFVIEDVTKNGYQLLDADIRHRPYNYSEVPLYMVMETPEQQLEDQLEAKERISRALRKDYQRCMADNRRLRDEQRISQEAYEQEVERLMSRQQGSSVFVAKLVEEFARVDYDQLDEFTLQVHELILNGEFARADSMLNSKGDMSARISNYLKERHAMQQEDSALNQQKQEVSQLDVHLRKQFADLAQDCMSRHQIFKLRYQNDSAAYYIELRAQLDTANVEFQRHAGDFLGNYLDNYSRALMYYQRGLEQSNRLYGEKSEWSVLFKNQIANIYYYQNRYAEALDYYNAALEVYQQNYGERNTDVLTILSNIARIYEVAYNDYGKALGIFEQVQAVLGELVGTKHDNYAKGLYNIGGVYDDMYDYSKAQDYYLQALGIYRELYGDRHAEVASVLSSLGDLYANEGKYDKAMEYHQQALSIREEVYGHRNLTTANSLHDVGNIYYRLKDYDKAMEYLLQALDVKKEKMGDNSAAVATTLNTIGNVYYDKKDYVPALDYYQQALSIRQQLLGNRHLKVAITLNNIAGVYRNMNEYAKAAAYYEQVLAIRKELLGAQHPTVGIVLDNLGDAYYNLKQNDKSLACYEEVIAIGAHPQGLDELDIVAALNWTSMFYNMKGQYMTAIEYLKRTTPMLRHIYGENHKEVASSLQLLGLVHQVRRLYDEAVDYYRQAFDVWSKCDADYSKQMVACADTIGTLCYGKKDFACAVEYFQRSLDIRLGTDTSQRWDSTDVEMARQKLLLSRYYLACAQGTQATFYEKHSITIIFNSKDIAGQQGLKGDYNLLEYDDWMKDSMTPVHEKYQQTGGKPHRIVILNDDSVSCHQFEDPPVVLLRIREVTPAISKSINKTYKEWKKQNRK